MVADVVIADDKYRSDETFIICGRKKKTVIFIIMYGRLGRAS